MAIYLYPKNRLISTADIKSDEFQGRVIIPEDLRAAAFLAITEKIADFASYPRVVLP